MGEDRGLIEPEGVNAASAAGLRDDADADPAASERTHEPTPEEQQPPEGVVGAPEQWPGKPGQQLEAGEG